MKHAKRIVVLFMAACMLAAAAGCGEGEKTASSSGSAAASGFDVDFGSGADSADAGASNAAPKNSGSAAASAETGSKGGSVSNVINKKDAQKYPGRATNLNGRTIKIMSYSSNMAGNDTTDWGKRAKKLNESIESTFNCKLEFLAVRAVNSTQVKASIAAGAPIVDLWWMQNVQEYVDAYAANVLQELDSLKVIDFSDRTRYTAGTEIATINGKHYGIAPNTYSYHRITFNTVLYCNLTVLKSAGYTADKLYALQDAGNWNWQNFETACAAVKQKGKIPVVEIPDVNLTFYQSLLNANNADWLSKNNTTVTFTGNTAPARAVLDQYEDWAKKGYIDFDAPAVQKNKWLNGEAAFWAYTIQYPWAEAPSSGGNKIKNVDYLLMYPPKGPAAKEYLTKTTDYSYTGIPKGIKRPNEVATILDAVNAALYTKDEEKELIKRDAMAMMKNPQSVKLLTELHAKGAPAISWSVLSRNIKINTNESKNGWYDLVQKVANGSLTQEAALQQVSNWNNLLSNVYTTR